MSDPLPDARTDLAVCVSGSAAAHGWAVPPATAFAIADALIARPGLLRAALGDPRGNGGTS